jgi:hypothetical protein
MEKEMNMESGNGNGSRPTMTTVAIGRDRYEVLAEYAKQEGTSVAAVVEEALTEFINEQN